MYWSEKEYSKQHKIKTKDFIQNGLDEIDKDIKVKIRTLRTDGKWW